MLDALRKARYCRKRACFRRSDAKIVIHVSDKRDDDHILESLVLVGGQALAGSPPRGRLATTIEAWLDGE